MYLIACSVCFRIFEWKCLICIVFDNCGCILSVVWKVCSCSSNFSFLSSKISVLVMVALNDADDVWDCHWDAIPATDSTNLMLELRESQFRLCAVCSTTSMLSCFAVKTMDCAESGILCEIQEQYGVARYVLSPCDERTHFGHN